MEAALIAPIEYLHYCTTNTLVCYSKFLSNKKYRDFFLKARVEGRRIILDSSPSLPRSSHTLDLLLSGIGVVNPDIVVLPSVDFSYPRTVSLVRDFSREYTSLPETIGLLQGTDILSLEKCYLGIRGYCDYIGLSSPLEKIAKRQQLIKDLGIREPVIYLEVFSNPYEELPPKDSVICTSFPIRLAEGLRYLKDYYPTPPALDFEMPAGRLISEIADKNVKEYLDYLDEANKR